MSRGIFSSLAILALFFANTNAQMLIPLYGACTSSVQCVGVAICFNHVCQCPPIYNAVGITCVYAGVDGEAMGPSPPGQPPTPSPFPGQSLPIAANPPVAAPGFPVTAGQSLPVGAAPSMVAPAFPVSAGPSLPLAAPSLMAPPLPGPPGAPFAYPGLPCPPGRSCMGNSVCVQGTCGCPAGQVVAGYSCVPPQRVLPGAPPMPAPAPAPAPFAPAPGPPSLGAPYFPVPPYGPVGAYPGDEIDFFLGARGFPLQGPAFPGVPVVSPLPATCPPTQVPLGPECFPPASIVNYPYPVPCHPSAPVPCIGGASCVAGVCACPPPFVWAGTACVPPSPPPPPPPSPALPPPAPFHPTHFIAAPYAALAPAPVQLRPAVLPGPPVPAGAPPPGALALGSACSAHNQCVVGAYCKSGVCQCRPAFLPYGSICVLRRRAKDEAERSRNNQKRKQ